MRIPFPAQKNEKMSQDFIEKMKQLIDLVADDARYEEQLVNNQIAINDKNHMVSKLEELIEELEGEISALEEEEGLIKAKKEDTFNKVNDILKSLPADEMGNAIKMLDWTMDE